METQSCHAFCIRFTDGINSVIGTTSYAPHEPGQWPGTGSSVILDESILISNSGSCWFLERWCEVSRNWESNQKLSGNNGVSYDTQAVVSIKCVD
jgi:hypothetical protein